MPEETTMLTGGISVDAIPQTSAPTNRTNINLPSLGPLWQSLNNALKTGLFMEALRNLNWSREYCFYCELDGVPSPFHRGGVLGLPCESVSFGLGEGKTYNWSAGINELLVPQSIGSLPPITLELLDDEQGTIQQFFERWYNQVYNPYYGVLPVTEACKQLTIYRQKGTRRNVKRIYYNLDEAQAGNSIIDYFKKGLQAVPRSTEGMDFLVFPSDSFQTTLNSSNSGLVKFRVTLQIAYFANQDFGDPTKHNGINSLLGYTFGNISDGTGWLDKIADYL